MWRCMGMQAVVVVGSLGMGRRRRGCRSISKEGDEGACA
jgi:hypothetical protein